MSMRLTEVSADGTVISAVAQTQSRSIDVVSALTGVQSVPSVEFEHNVSTNRVLLDGEVWYARLEPQKGAYLLSGTPDGTPEFTLRYTRDKATELPVGSITPIEGVATGKAQSVGNE